MNTSTLALEGKHAQDDTKCYPERKTLWLPSLARQHPAYCRDFRGPLDSRKSDGEEQPPDIQGIGLKEAHAPGSMSPRLSELPTELLQEILSIATDVPDPLSCFAQDYPGFRRDPTREPYQRYRSSLATKLAICGVSRQWNTLGTPLLYERIVIADPAGNHEQRRNQLYALLRTFTEESIGGVSTTQGQPVSRLGGFVRRLDLAYPGGPPELSYQEERQMENRVLVGIIGRLRNLEVLGLFTSSNTSPLDTLEILSPRLTHLHWRTDAYGTGFEVPLDRFLSFLDRHLRIETIDMQFTFTLGQTLPSSRGTAFPGVRHWVPRQNQVKILKHLPPHTFPNLEVVTWPFLAHPSNGLPRLCEFLAVHGQNLTKVLLKPQWVLREVLEAVAAVCPHLREIELVYHRRMVYAATITDMAVTFSMPGVVTLGLSLFNFIYRHEVGWYGTITLPWKDIFPALRSIKLLDEIDVIALKAMPEAFQEVVAHCRTYGVDLEDHFGGALAG
ncbi:hypothetical protein NMY22_g16546 [Coprinellus aureogranulatus]|nr:hypothetical protein NMY22_g16546 [Coprinellus aureogranulatus]